MDATLEVLKNGKSVAIRPLSTTDGPALASFYESIPPKDERFYCPHPLTREYAMANARSVGRAHKICLVAENDSGVIAGYSWIQKEGKDSPSGVFGICVRGDYQGSGLGTKLISRIIEWAKLDGPPLVSLTVQKANPAAFNLYRKMGFEIVREQLRPSDQEPEYSMELRIR